jgi:hypothetical protein
MGKGQPTIEQQVQGIINFAKVIEMFNKKIDFLQDKVDKIKVYVRLLQEGDPENENPKKILDFIDQVLANQMESK